MCINHAFARVCTCVSACHYSSYIPLLSTGVVSGHVWSVGQSVDSDSYKKASTFGFTIKVSRVLSTEVLRNIKEGYTIYVPKIYSVCEK